MPQTEHFNFSIVNITESATPEVKIQKRNGWVEYGKDNDYFEHLINIYNNSSIQKSLVDGIVRRIYGLGLVTNTNKPLDTALARKMFNYDVLMPFILDYKLTGNAAVKIVTNKVGVPVEVYHQPIETLRPAICNEDGEIEGYYYSANWKESRRTEYKPTYIEAFKEGNKKAGEYIAYLKEYSPDSFYFGKPDYVGATKWIETDIEISLYHLSNVKSGFSGATLIQLFNGQPTPQRREELERLFKNKFSGSQGQKIVFMYHNDREEMAEVTNAPIPEADKQYEFLANETRQQIMIGHRITSPMLLGIRQETGLGNNADEIRQANNLLNTVVVKPFQIEIERFINSILTEAGITSTVNFTPLKSININSNSTSNIDSPIDEEAELIKKEASYNGAQISSALQILENVNNGLITEQQAIVFLIQMLQFEPQLAESLFNGKVQLSQIKKKVIAEKDQDRILEFLEDEGEDEDELLQEGFQVWHEEDLDGDDELKVEGEKLNKIELLSAWGINADNLSKYDVKSKENDGVWLVRYQYALAKQNAGEPAIIPTSRQFCKKMIDYAKNGNRVYKREVLEKLNNPEFGSYEIFWYKGSYNCRHVWKRKIYFKSFSTNKVEPVGNVPYVVSRVNDKRATTKNKKPKRR